MPPTNATNTQILKTFNVDRWQYMGRDVRQETGKKYWYNVDKGHPHEDPTIDKEGRT